jgi:aminoglycoside 6'-N-acetyltransferase
VDTAAGIGYLIGDSSTYGRGLDTVAIATFIWHVFARFQAIRLAAVAVSQANAASWRSLEKAGYRRCWVGELDSDDPSEEGPIYLYRCERSATPTCADPPGKVHTTELERPGSMAAESRGGVRSGRGTR